VFIVVLNPDSAAGRNVEEDRLRALFHDAGAEIAIVSPDSLTRATVTAHSVRAVVAAGGDGTVSSVAASIAGGTIPLGVLPLGTLNHFAKDLKIPLDLGRR
jgi:diacylglycerol kinase family enzyme